MTSFLNPCKVDKGRPLDPTTLHILSVVNSVAAELAIPYIVVGATARDLLLFHVFGIPVTRATADIDFAIAVDSWERFQALRGALLASGHFREGKVEHRIYLKAPSITEEIPVDLIPFGGVAERRDSLATAERNGDDGRWISRCACGGSSPASE